MAVSPSGPNARGTHEAEVVRCPACGSGCAPSSPVCAHCGNHLATLRCPGCSTMHFAGALLCTRCGQELRVPLGLESQLRCPRCQKEMMHSELGDLSGCECTQCGGLFLDALTLKRAIAARERGESLPLRAVEQPAPPQPQQPITYLKCPVCAKLMNRVNFGRSSGVVVDVCRDHGTWFDAGELTRVLEFVRDGGLRKALFKEREEQRETRRRATAQYRTLSPTAGLASTASPAGVAADVVDGLVDLLMGIFRG